MEVIQALITGRFSEDEFRCICDVIRSIERDHPTETYEIVVLEGVLPDQRPPCTEDGRDFIHAVFPTLPNDTPQFEVIKFPRTRNV